MTKYLLLLVSVLLLNINSSFAQKKKGAEETSKLIAGPMLSYIDKYHAQMWMLVSKETEEVSIKLESFDENRNQEYVFDITNPKSYNNSAWYDFHISNYNHGDEIPVVLTLEELVPDAEYHVEVYIDSVLVEEEMDIYTPRNYLADIYFLLGHDLNLSDDNSSGDKILNTMSEVESDFMVWMGNNIHLTKEEKQSFKSILKKYETVRKRENVNDFIKLMPQIATWGHMDYGSINTKDQYSLKDSSLMAFNMYWPNAPKKVYNYTFREYGTYKKFDYEDIEIFLLDQCMFKTKLDDPKPELLGADQMNLFINEVMASKAAFKFIVSSKSVLSEGVSEEPFKAYEAEYTELMRRLELSRINGVVFVTGDTNNAELLVENRDNGYPLHELQVPGLSPEGQFDGNFARIKVEGDYRKRICTFEVYDQSGEEVFNKRIHQSEVSY